MMRAPQLLPLLAFVCLTSSFAIADDSSDVDKTIAKITLRGGEVTRDDKLPGRPVTGIDFQGSKHVNDGYVHLLRDFTNLKSLSLRDTQISDVGLKELKKLTTLASLDLTETNTTDAGIKELKKSLPNLVIGQ